MGTGSSAGRWMVGFRKNYGVYFVDGKVRIKTERIKPRRGLVTRQKPQIQSEEEVGTRIGSETPGTSVSTPG